MKVVILVCLVALVEAAPAIIENVQQTDYNQAGAYNQPLAYNQPQEYSRLLDNQARTYSQPLDYNLLRAYNQVPDYNQRIYNQALDYNQLADIGQRLDYDPRLDYLRGRRSNQVAVVSPCAAASMQAHYSPYHGYGYASPYYVPRVYRADEEPEMMSFSEGDQVDMARSYETPSGLAYGVFPNAKTTGCGVPLLVSCSPNVVQGRLVKTEPHNYSAGNYRNLRDHPDAVHEHSDAVHEHQDAVHEAKTQ